MGKEGFWVRADPVWTSARAGQLMSDGGVGVEGTESPKPRSRSYSSAAARTSAGMLF